MTGKIKTMRGKMIDMGAITAANSKAVALGNANMNARGDIVDRSGNVLKKREVVVQEYYNSNPKAVTQAVSLKDLGDEVMTPKQAIDKIEADIKSQSTELPAKKRKLIDDE